MRTLFRAAGGKSFGLGHIARSYKLAKKINYTRQSPMLALTLDKGATSSNALLNQVFDKLINIPFGLLDEEDARLTAAAALNLGCDLVVTDICHRGIIEEPSRLILYHQTLKKEGIKKIICIGDCRVSETHADLTIVPYECTLNEQQKFSATETYYHGLDYFVLDPELNRARSIKIEKKSVTKILVCISGSDPLEVSPLVLQGLQKINRDDLEVRIIVSSAMSEKNLNAIQSIASESSEFLCVDFSFDFSQHILWSDIAITGEGLVKYETASGGVPTLIISQFDHSSDVLKNFLNSGAAKYLGSAENITPDNICEEIKEVLDNMDERGNLSKNGRALMDGEGVDRIFNLISEFSEG
jgi:spore coat polysaccharide biosynthesis predicted glycosyltransferase SpsG